MIFVDRRNVPIPDSLALKDSIGKKETAKVIAFFSAQRGGKYRPFKTFKAYNLPDVREALKKLFHNKCAYCESYITTTYFGDVEHFRPKAEIAFWKGGKTNIRPGYYRWASDWNNLLFACKICNSINTQKIHDGTSRLVGKGNYFPLRGRKKHCNLKTSIKEEENYRLLINPCVDKPEQYFQFDINTGNIKVKTKDTIKIEQADTSIEIYGLHRFDLSTRRLKLIKRVNNLLRRINEHISDIDEASTLKRKKLIQDRLVRDIDELKDLRSPTSEYSAVVKQISNPFFRKFKKG